MFCFLLDPRGRLDRRGYLSAVLGLMLCAVVLTTLALWPSDFTTGGIFIDGLWSSNYAEYGRRLDQVAERSLTTLCALIAVHALCMLSFLSLSARRLQDMGRQGGYAALVLLTGPALLACILAVLPGDRSANAYGPAARVTNEAAAATEV